jgi:hypothetical protein
MGLLRHQQGFGGDGDCHAGNVMRDSDRPNAGTRGLPARSEKE